MRHYMNSVAQAILDADDDHLNILRWITYLVTDTSVDASRLSMAKQKFQESWEKMNGEDPFKYDDTAKKVIDYAMTLTSDGISELSEYALLLNVFCSILVYNNESNSFEIGSGSPLGSIVCLHMSQFDMSWEPAACKILEEQCERPFPVSEDFLDNVDIADWLILFLYFLCADISTDNRIGLIDNKMSNLFHMIESNKINYKAPFDNDNIPLNNLKIRGPELFETLSDIDKFPSFLSNYFARKKSAGKKEDKYEDVVMDSTIEHMKEYFNEFSLLIPDECGSVLPAMLILLFNAIKPTRYGKIYSIKDFHETVENISYYDIAILNESITQYKDEFLYTFKESIPSPADFLKEIILPPIKNYKSNLPMKIEDRFRTAELEALKRLNKMLYEKSDVSERNANGFKSLPPEHLSPSELEKKFIQALKDADVNSATKITSAKNNRALSEQLSKYVTGIIYKNSCFTDVYYEYFESFVKLVQDGNFLSSFSCEEMIDRIDRPLSIVYLNRYTMWYDALLLLQGMNIQYTDYDGIYMKALSLFEYFDGIIHSFFDNFDNLRSELLSAEMSDRFYQASLSRLNIPDVADIFSKKPSPEEKNNPYKRMSPIYKLVKLMDCDEFSSSFFENIEEEFEALMPQPHPIEC